MSAPSKETETVAVEFSREERWVIHHSLVEQIDSYDEDATPPHWIPDVVETIESGGRTFTTHQARKLSDAMATYLTDAPQRDVLHGDAVCERLEREL